MRKQLFETKIKDGLFLVGIIVIIIVASLSLDDVQGAFKRDKFRVTVYVPSYEVPSDGPVLKPGDGVKVYKKVVGRVTRVDFFVAVVRKPVEDDAAAPHSGAAAAGPTENATGGAAPAASPSPSAAPAPPATRPEIVSGLKVEAELYGGEFPEILAMITPDSAVKVESQTLGDSSLQLSVSPTGESVKDQNLVHFPRNHASLWKPKDPASRLGRELKTAAEVTEVRNEIARSAPQKGTAEPEKKNPSEEF
jgi:hypothetical protein